jgi:hypothetical protein
VVKEKIIQSDTGGIQGRPVEVTRQLRDSGDSYDGFVGSYFCLPDDGLNCVVVIEVTEQGRSDLEWGDMLVLPNPIGDDGLKYEIADLTVSVVPT